MSPDPPMLDYVPHGRVSRPIWAGMPRPRSLGGRIAFGTLRSVGVRLATVALLAMLLTGIWIGIDPAVAVITGVVIFVLTPAVAGALRQVRRRRGTVILTYLDQAARLNLPLARMLDAAQRSESPATARRLRRLRDLLEDGAPLEVALPVAAPEVPARAVALVGAGERLGRLHPALDRVTRGVRTDLDDTDTDTGPAAGALTGWYPALMATAMTLLIGILLIFVVPKFEDLFRDFGLKLPPATLLLLRVAREFANSDVWPWVALLAFALFVGGTFRGLFAPGRSAGRLGTTDQVLWRLPVVHGLERDRGLADACHVIADALRTGRTLPRAIDEAARLEVNAVLRRRLCGWRDRVHAGHPADQAARDARLPALIAGMIGPGRGGDAAAAADFLAAYYAGRFSRAAEVLRAAAGPLLVLLFGGVVLFLFVALYQPILDMMDMLSASFQKVHR